MERYLIAMDIQSGFNVLKRGERQGITLVGGMKINGIAGN
jgi:hypothetical protein